MIEHTKKWSYHAPDLLFVENYETWQYFSFYYLPDLSMFKDYLNIQQEP